MYTRDSDRSTVVERSAVHAVVVTYNPVLADLALCLDAASREIHRIFLVDNMSTNRADLTELVRSSRWPVDIVPLEENRGIASALNVGLSCARDAGAILALILDQDSIIAETTVERLLRHAGGDVALCAPLVSDRNVDAPTITSNIGVTEADYCINSGSLISLEAWRQVGGYDENMFIDFVDFDFCLRLRVANFRIIKDNAVVISHAIGEQSRHGRVVAYNHSAFRLKHMARDMLYYAAKHRDSPRNLRVARRSIGGTLLVIAKKLAVVTFFESSKLAKIKALLSGTFSGLKLQWIGPSAREPRG